MLRVGGSPWIGGYELAGCHERFGNTCLESFCCFLFQQIGCSCINSICMPFNFSSVLRRLRARVHDDLGSWCRHVCTCAVQKIVSIVANVCCECTKVVRISWGLCFTVMEIQLCAPLQIRNVILVFCFLLENSAFHRCDIQFCIIRIICIMCICD